MKLIPPGLLGVSKSRMRKIALGTSASALAILLASASAQTGAPTSRTIDGVFLSRGGVLTNIALDGQPVAGLGTLGRSFDGPAFNNNSTVA